MIKHEEVVDEILELLKPKHLEFGTRCYAISAEQISDILSKHYDPAPELTKGMWVKLAYTVGTPRLLLNGEKFIRIDGTTGEAGHLLPHTFTESDLKLLDCEENTYELTQDSVGYYWVECLDKEKSVDFTIRCGKTVHEAVKNAFNARIGEELRKNLVK